MVFCYHFNVVIEGCSVRCCNVRVCIHKNLPLSLSHTNIRTRAHTFTEFYGMYNRSLTVMWPPSFLFYFRVVILSRKSYSCCIRIHTCITSQKSSSSSTHQMAKPQSNKAHNLGTRLLPEIVIIFHSYFYFAFLRADKKVKKKKYLNYFISVCL